MASAPIAAFKVILILSPAYHGIPFQSAAAFSAARAHRRDPSQYSIAKYRTFSSIRGEMSRIKTHTGRNPFKIPDMGNRRSQLNVAHPFPANLGTGHFYAAAITNFPFIPHSLILCRSGTPSPWSAQRYVHRNRPSRSGFRVR